MIQQRLLDIAIAEFGARGLDGASTRGIAQAAGTAMSSITYHYGGKEGLYCAPPDYIAERIGDLMSATMKADAVPDGIGAQEARQLLHDILERLADTMAAHKSAAWSLFVMREQMEPTEAFDRIYGGWMGHLLGMLVDLVRIATGRHDGHTAQVAVITLVGQVVSLRASRASVLKLLDIDDIDAAASSALKFRIAANTDAILDRLIAERQELP